MYLVSIFPFFLSTSRFIFVFIDIYYLHSYLFTFACPVLSGFHEPIVIFFFSRDSKFSSGPVRQRSPEPVFRWSIVPPPLQVLQIDLLAQLLRSEPAIGYVHPT
jgi:hypothetical protein